MAVPATPSTDARDLMEVLLAGYDSIIRHGSVQLPVRGKEAS